MKKRIFALLVTITLFLPACGGSQNVKLTPLNEVTVEAADFVPEEYENLTFTRDEFSVTVPENLAHCTLREVGCFDLEYGDELMRWWIPDEVWDEQYVTTWDDTYAYAFSSIFDRPMEGTGEWYAAVWCTGTVIYAQENGWDHFQHSAEGLDRSYNVNTDDLETTVSLADGELTLRSIVELAEKFASDWLSQTDLQISLRPQYLYICTDDNMEKFAKVIFQTCWNGVPISSVVRQYPDSATFTLSIPSAENGYTGDIELCSVTATMTSGEKLDFFGGGHGSVEPYDPGTVCENLVSLSTACDILSETISSYGAQEIKDVALEYRLNIIGSDQPEDTYRFVDEETGELLPDRSGVQLYRTSYDLYDAVPYWAFYAKDKQRRELIFYVNCLNGEVQIMDNQAR